MAYQVRLGSRATKRGEIDGMGKHKVCYRYAIGELMPEPTHLGGFRRLFKTHTPIKGML